MGFPWQAPFLIIGVAGLVWIPIWFSLLRSGDLRFQPPAEKGGGEKPLDMGQFIFQVITLGTIVITISLAWQFQRAWLPKYLKEFHHYSETAANYFTSGYYIVADIGCIFSGAVVTFLTSRRVSTHWARMASFAGCTALVAISLIVPLLEKGPVLLITLSLVGAGSLGAHPQYYALVQELPPRHMGALSGILAAFSWVVVGFMQGAIGQHIKQTGSYDLPMIVTGAAPLVGLLVLGIWVWISGRSGEKTA